VAITVISLIALVFDDYRSITPYKYWDRVILYLIIPLLIIIAVFRAHPRHYGFTFGDWKAGIILTIVGIMIMAPILYVFGQRDPTLNAYYRDHTAGLPWTTFLDLIGWGFLFRGRILSGYARRFGSEALWLQSVPFVMAHIGKPEPETFFTIIGGFGFGWVAWRTQSFVWPFLIHWFVATFLIMVAAAALPG
jgi:membrane protease YdiL (CAAX protease family)